MLPDEILISFIIFCTVLIPNLIFIVIEGRKKRIKDNSDYFNLLLKVTLRTLVVTFLLTIVFSILIFMFTDSDPGTAVAVVGLWMIEILTFLFCCILSSVSLWIYKIQNI